MHEDKTKKQASAKVPFFARKAEARLVVKTNIKAGEHLHKEADIKNP